MKQLLRLEHWIIQRLKFDRMTNNLFWLAAILLPFIIALIAWLLLLHEQPDIHFIVSRDSAFSGKVAEIAYRNGDFYFTPLLDNTLLNLSPLNRRAFIRESDELVIGHTIFQVRELDGWTPHLQVIGYYATDRNLANGVAVGRSIQSEEANQWEINDIVVSDSTIEPVHFFIHRGDEAGFRITNASRQGTYVYTQAAGDDTLQWWRLRDSTVLQAGQYIRAGASMFKLLPIPTQEALVLKIEQGTRPTYTLSREAQNIIGGLRLIPNDYIPDYLVDEEFIEYVRQAIEHDLFVLDDPEQRQEPPRIYVRGFDAEGRLVAADFQQLSEKEKFLLHNIFRFREAEGVTLRWRRPFNREAPDSYQFYPDQIENFVLDLKHNRVENIYRYAARLPNLHMIAAEMTTDRGNIYDRDRYSHARLQAHSDSDEARDATLLLFPSENPDTILTLNPNRSLDDGVYVGGGYRFSNGDTVAYHDEHFSLQTDGQSQVLQEGDTFQAGRYTFRYHAPGNGLLAGNQQDGSTTRRYYPLGERLAHLIGYSYARSQFKGNLEAVFDKVLLGFDKQPPWWSLDRTTETVPGNHVILTIDDDLQRIVYAELEKKLRQLNSHYHQNTFTGAALMLNHEGEILASATIPSYNPNNLRSILKALRESADDHWNSAFINRATQKRYPPGSTMKVIMATIALDNKAQFLRPIGDGQYLIRDGNGVFACTGWLSSFRGQSFGQYGIKDFAGASHDVLTLDTALTKSCNNTFAFLALTAGWQMIQRYAERYGFNQRFDFLPYDMFKDDPQIAAHVSRSVRDPLTSLASCVPTPTDDFKLSQLARMGIGQWEIQATPLQMAMVAMTVGNQGLRPYPHLVRGIEEQQDGEMRYLPYPKKEAVFPAEVLAELFPMMQHVVQKGSGVRMAHSKIQYYSLKDHVAGKTGTAEVEDQRGRKENVAWFISFAPVEQSQLALAVVIEKGSITSSEAVEVARGIWEKAVLLYPQVFLSHSEE